MLSGTMPFRRHSISISLSLLVYLLRFSSMPLSSVLGLPMVTNIEKAATTFTHEGGAVGSAGSAERVTTDFTHFATTSAGPPNEHGPSFLAIPASKGTSANKPVTEAVAAGPLPREAAPTSAHPASGVRPFEEPIFASHLSDGPNTVVDKMSRFFNRVFSRNNSAKFRRGLKTFISRLPERSGLIKMIPKDVSWDNAHWRTLTIKSNKGLIKEAKFDQLDIKTLEELFQRDKGLNALWDSYSEELPLDKKMLLISQAYRKFLKTPLKELTSEKCEGWIYTLAYKMNLAKNNPKHVEAPLEALSQFLLLDMRAKFRQLDTAEGKRVFETTQSLQNYLKARFLETKEDDLREIENLQKVPWAYELFYYDSDISWSNQAKGIQEYFQAKGEKDIASTIESLAKTVATQEPDLKNELARFGRMLEKNNPDISSQHKTALFLFLADIAFNTHSSTLLIKVTEEARLTAKSIFSQMFSERKLMTHNMQRLHYLDPQSFPLKIEPSTVPS